MHIKGGVQLVSSRKVNHIIPLYATCCIIISLIIAWTNVKFFEAELKEQDIKVFSKIKELNKKKGEINSKRIKLDRGKLELHKHTYIQNINLKIDDIPYDKVEDRYVLYYIPRWMVRENYMLTRLLQALTISCFFSSITIWLFDKQIKKLQLV